MKLLGCFLGWQFLGLAPLLVFIWIDYSLFWVFMAVLLANGLGFQEYKFMHKMMRPKGDKKCTS